MAHGSRREGLPRGARLAAIGLLLALAACPRPFDPQTGVVRKGAAAFRVAAPGAGWRLVPGGGDAAFLNDATLATMAASASCGERGDPPLRVLLNHLVIGFTQKKVLSEELVPLDGREALRATLAARLDGIPRRLLLYVMKKDGCVYDLQYGAPDAAFDAGLPAFEAFVKGFGTIR